MADVLINPKFATWVRTAPSGNSQIGMADGFTVDTTMTVSEVEHLIGHLIGQLSDRLVTVVDATMVNPT